MGDYQQLAIKATKGRTLKDIAGVLAKALAKLEKEGAYGTSSTTSTETQKDSSAGTTINYNTNISSGDTRFTSDRSIYFAEDYASLNTFLAAIGDSEECTLIVSKLVNVTATITLTSNVHPLLMGDGVFNIYNNVVLTWMGLPETSLPLRKIFYGEGSVTGLSEARPEWWGVIAGSDCATAFNAAAASLTNGGLVKGNPGTTYTINSKVTSAIAGVVFEFYGCTITNPTALATETLYSETCNALINITASHSGVRGGYWYDIASEGIRATGAFTGGDTYSGTGYIEDLKFADLVFENIDEPALIVRFFNDTDARNITVRDKGAGLAGGHSFEIGFKYGGVVTGEDNRVINSDNGGAFYHLYVSDFTLTNCIANDITNSLNKISCTPFYSGYCGRGTLNGCHAYLPDGGVPCKFSYTDNKITMNGGTYEVCGDNDDIYAGVFFQGSQYAILNNAIIKASGKPCIRIKYHTTPSNVNSQGIHISGCVCLTVYEGADTAFDGSGLMFEALTSETRMPLMVTGSWFFGGNMYVLQAKDSLISNCLFVTDADYITSSAGIWFDRCLNTAAKGCYLINNDATDEAKVGVCIDRGTGVSVEDCHVRFEGTTPTGSVAYKATGAFTDALFKNNYAKYAETKYDTGTAAIIHSVLFSNANVSAAPTDAEIDAAFGTPASVGKGFVGIIDDNGGEAAVWMVTSTGTKWWYAAMTEAS